MTKRFIFIVSFLTLSLNIFAHSGKPKHHVIIDTDGAIDDMRAITILLANNDVRILGITCSQGSLLPNEVYEKVTSLMSAFYCEGIPVGVSPQTNFELPAWYNFAKNINWNNQFQSDTKNAIKSDVLLADITKNYKSKITLIALGSLKTYADWIKKNPQIVEKIDRIIWYNSHEIQKGFNYKISPESYDFIKNSGILLEIVGVKDKPVNTLYINKLKKYNSIYAKQIVRVHSQKIVKKKIMDKHLKFYDDFVSMYLTMPLFFGKEQQKNVNLIYFDKIIPDIFLYRTIGDLLLSATQANNRVFVNFPTDTLLYLPDYAKILSSTLEKYGVIEWKAVAMTNEIHGHSGIYSIMGAKMGIRAMEYFNVGVNNMFVTTFAGHKPPLSCFNDGVQISTGSTVGQGLIAVSDSISKIPSAIFEFNGKKVHISLKKEIAEQMQNSIKIGIKTHGLLTEKYWLYIEKLAIKYWAEYDRHNIFEIREL